MELLRAFRGLRAPAEFATAVSAPPYDVMNAEEAKAMAGDNQHSFLRVSRPEIEIETLNSPYDDIVYAKAAENFQELQANGVLQRDDTPAYYLYRLTFQGQSQLGIVAEVSVEGYDNNRVKKHEFTRPTKEDDRTRHVLTTGANSGPVFLAYEANENLRSVMQDLSNRAPDVSVNAGDGVLHELWVVQDDAGLARMQAAVAQIENLYIADGHHRCAAASRACAEMRQQVGSYTGDESFNYFLGVSFPHDELRVFDYNRVVRELNGLDSAEFLGQIEAAFDVSPASEAVRPVHAGQFGLYLDGKWYQLDVHADKVPSEDPVGRLDAAVLSNLVLAPLLGIEDPRRDERIDFVGGIRGLGELERRVDSGEMRVAFSLYPTALTDLMAVADANEVMPPKSTWFEPKLRDGLVVQLIQD